MSALRVTAFAFAAVVSGLVAGGYRKRLKLPTAAHPDVGACWAFVRDRFSYFIYGSYPIPERWRVDIFFALLAVGITGRWASKVIFPVPGPLTVQREKLLSTTFVSTK